MKSFKKFAAFILVAALVFSIFPGASIISGADNVPHPTPTYLISVKYDTLRETTYFVWNKVENATGFEIWYRRGNTYDEFEKLVTVHGNYERVGVKKKDLDPSYDYDFKIRSFILQNNVAYNSSFSSVLYVTKMFTSGSVETIAKPKAPTLKVSVSGKTIKLSWTKASGASGYTIYYMPETGTGNAYEELASVSSSKTNYSTSRLDTSKSYKFRIRAYTDAKDGSVYSDYSNIVVSKKAASISNYFTVTIKKGSTLNLSVGSSSASWKTSNKNVATVSKGVVKGIKAGSSVITATSGSTSVKIKVVVK